MSNNTPKYLVNEAFVKNALDNRATAVSEWTNDAHTRGFIEGLDHVMEAYFNFHEEAPKPAPKPRATKKPATPTETEAGE